MKATTILFTLLMINITMASDGNSLLDNSRQLEAVSSSALPDFTVSDELMEQLLTDDGIKEVMGNITYTPVTQVGTIDPEEEANNAKALANITEEQMKDDLLAALEEGQRQAENPDSVAKADSKLYYHGCNLYSTPCACPPENACCIIGSFRIFNKLLFRFARWFTTWPHYQRTQMVFQIIRNRYTNTCFGMTNVYLEQYMHRFLVDFSRKYGQ